MLREMIHTNSDVTLLPTPLYGVANIFFFNLNWVTNLRQIIILLYPHDLLSQIIYTV